MMGTSNLKDNASQFELTDILSTNTEPINLVNGILKFRSKQKIESKKDLKDIIKTYTIKKRSLDYKREVKLAFQNLRIFVNQELLSLKMMISNMDQILTSNSLVIILGFHDDEHFTIKKELSDYRRIQGSKFVKFWAIGKLPKKREISENISSKSAKLYAVRQNRSKDSLKLEVGRMKEIENSKMRMMEEHIQKMKNIKNQ